MNCLRLWCYKSTMVDQVEIFLQLPKMASSYLTCNRAIVIDRVFPPVIIKTSMINPMYAHSSYTVIGWQFSKSTPLHCAASITSCHNVFEDGRRKGEEEHIFHWAWNVYCILVPCTYHSCIQYSFLHFPLHHCLLHLPLQDCLLHLPLHHCSRQGLHRCPGRVVIHTILLPIQQSQNFFPSETGPWRLLCHSV